MMIGGLGRTGWLASGGRAAELHANDLVLAAALDFHLDQRSGPERANVVDHLLRRLRLVRVDADDHVARAQPAFAPGRFGSTRSIVRD